ncbi:hypothetical protein ACJIZ3_005046 [Penstemon smallii]|uniref:Uncharacterized protein n=1 Tax=Penstemon smallii TaxID=265156 RepID=A0ABD3S3S0_9LAMI
MGSVNFVNASLEELEIDLVAIKNSLLASLSSPSEELLVLLEKAENILIKFPQVSPTRSIARSVGGLMKALKTDEILKHPEKNIQFVVASCMNEITRITAPLAPYKDKILKVAFQLFLVLLEQFSCESTTRWYRQRRMIETMAKVKSCYLMMDVDSKVVAEMFQIFLNTISCDHPTNTFYYMKMVMCNVIQETDGNDLTFEHVKPLIDSVRMENQDISPISWELGRHVIESCATILQPHIREAVKKMEVNIDDYAEILGSLCRNKSSNGDNMMEKEVSPTVESGNNGVSNSDVVSEAEQEACVPESNKNVPDDENLSEAIKCCEKILQLKTNNVTTHSKAAEIVQSGMNTGYVRSKKGIRTSSFIKPEEGYEYRWQSYSSQKEKDDFGETSRSKKKESMENQQNEVEWSSTVRRTILQSKGKKRGSSALKGTGRKNIAGEGSVSGKKKDEILSDTSEEVEDESEKETMDEETSQEQKLESNVDKVVEHRSASKPTKTKKRKNLSQEKGKKPEKPVVEHGEELVNSRIQVWWPMDKVFYAGTVKGYYSATKKHMILYDDGETEILNLKKEKWELLSADQPQETQSSQKENEEEETGQQSPAKEPIKSQKWTAKRKAGSSTKRAASSPKRSKSESRGIVIHVIDDDEPENFSP